MRRPLVAILLCGAPGSVLADPALSITSAAHLEAWERAPVKVTVHNTTSKPIVPLAISLASRAGGIYAWGMNGECPGARRGCSVEVRWTAPEQARRRGAGWELLLGVIPTQQARAPTALELAAPERLLRITPIAPGARVELEASLIASYDHDGVLTATMTYASVDPRVQPLCAPRSASAPSSPTFVPCVPVTTATAPVYVHESDLARGAQTVTAGATFAVDRPKFDLDAARARAKVASGPEAYLRASKRWVLVDETRKRTLVIGATGTPESLPGDWIERLVELATYETVTVYWNVASAAEGKRVTAAMRKVGLSLAPFRFKGHTQPLRLAMTFGPAHVSVVARELDRLGYRLDGMSIRPR